MNRNFRAREFAMCGMMKQIQMVGSHKKEKDEDLELFLEMHKREKQQDNHLHNYENFDPPEGSKSGSSPMINLSLSPPQKTNGDDFLNSENNKNDYDWLLSPPGSPLFPCLEMEGKKTGTIRIGTSNICPTVPKSKLSTPKQESSPMSNLVHRQTTSPTLKLNSPNMSARRPSSSASSESKRSTPVRRPTIPNTPKPTRPSTPTSRPILPSTKPATSARSSTPPTRSTSRSSITTSTIKISTVPSTVRSSTATSSIRSPSMPNVRSSTLVTKSTTPTARLALSTSKPANRAATPTHRPYTPSNVLKVVSTTSKPTDVLPKSSPTTLKNPVPFCGTSPIVKSRAWKPFEIPGFSLVAPPNLRTSLPDRPISASRGRPGTLSTRSSSVELGPSGRPKRQSCSPSRGRAPNGRIRASGGSVPAVSRGQLKVNDSISPVVIGTKMVERVVSMRKLAPPKQDDKPSPRGNMFGRSSSSQDGSGFGRMLSKKSLDMAMRHMDIRRNIPGNLRPLFTNIPSSSMYSVRSGPTRSRTVSMSDSCLVTSSNASSELSVNYNATGLYGSELEDDGDSVRSGRSPANLFSR